MLDAPLQTKAAVAAGAPDASAPLDAGLEFASGLIRRAWRRTDGARAARGRFITLEGGEGAGKSAQARRLAAQAASDGLAVVATREPGGSPGAEALREVILSGARGALWRRRARRLLFSAARIDHIDRRSPRRCGAATG